MTKDSKQVIKQWFEDERAIGLKCWFSSKHIYEGESASILTRVKEPDDGTFLFESDDMVPLFPNCRIAQGDKTPYYGNGQPVPDEVTVRLWLTEDASHQTEGLAQDFDWSWEGEGDIIHYQVQAQQPEVEQDSFKDKPTTDLVQNTIETMNVSVELMANIETALSDAKATTTALMPLLGEFEKPAYRQRSSDLTRLLGQLNSTGDNNV